MKGTLKTISLPSLVQAICLEQRKVALQLERNGLEGMMYFELGQIAHASLGNLVGDEAVIELVAWEEGTFTISSYEVLPRRTVTAPWNHLLMEGMRQHDERRLQEESRQSELNLTPGQLEHDGRVENGLITMLSNLEHTRTILLSDCAKEGKSAVAQTLAEMVATVDKYLDAAPVPIDKVSRGDFIADNLLAQNGQTPSTYQESVHALKEMLPSPDELLNPSQVEDEFDAFESRMLDLLRGYLSLFSHHYYSPIAADQWIEASTIFVSDLGETLSELEGTI